PSVEDAERLAVEGGPPAVERQGTLLYPGEPGWGEERRRRGRDQVERSPGSTSPRDAKVFEPAVLNPGEDHACVVYLVGDDPLLTMVHEQVHTTLGDMDIPQQHTPWFPHITITYDTTDTSVAEEGVGPIRFDRIRVSFDGEVADFLLGEQPEEESVENEESQGVVTADVVGDPDLPIADRELEWDSDSART